MTAERKSGGLDASSEQQGAAPERPVPGRSPLPESRERASRKESELHHSKEREVSHFAPPRVESFREEFAPDWRESEAPAADWMRGAPMEAPPPPGLEEPISEAPRSPGYYSARGANDSLSIPKAPRVPRLSEPSALDERPTIAPPVDDWELDDLSFPETEPAPTPSAPPGSLGPYSPSGPETVRSPSTSSVPPRSSELPHDTIPARSSEFLPPRRSSVPPAPLVSRPVARRPSAAQVPPRIYFSPHVRKQASEWARTGSLSLPGCSSPRHARAVQRALLLALLTEPGWEHIPEGLRQRAGWLFCKEWDAATEQAHPYCEVDDLAAVMSLPIGDESRFLLSRTVAAYLPESAAAPRPSRPPPGRYSAVRASSRPHRPSSRPAKHKL